MSKKKTTIPTKRRYEDDDDYAPSTSVNITELRKRSGHVETGTGDVRSERKNQAKYADRQDSLESDEIEISNEPICSYEKENSGDSTIIDLDNSPIREENYEIDCQPIDLSRASTAASANSNETLHYIVKSLIHDEPPDVRVTHSDSNTPIDVDRTATTATTVPTKNNELNSSSDTSFNISDVPSELVETVLAMQIKRRMEKVDRKTALLRMKIRTDAEIRSLDMEARQMAIKMEINKKREQIKVEQKIAELQWIQNEKKEKMFDRYVTKCVQNGFLPTKKT